MADFKFVAGAIIALVVILIVMSAYGKLPALAQGGGETIDKTAEALGVPLNLVSSPKILSVTPSVGPDGTLAVTWTLNKDAQDIYGKSGADFRAEFLYNETPGDKLKSVCTVYLIGSKTTGTQDGFDCNYPFQKSQNKVVVNKASGPAPAGGYEIRLSLKAEGSGKKFIAEQTASYGFFTRAYLNNLDKDVKGCHVTTEVVGTSGGTVSSNDCNVMECKRAKLRSSLSPTDCLSGKGEAGKKVYERVVEAFNKAFPTTSPTITSLEPCPYPAGWLPISAGEKHRVGNADIDEKTAFSGCTPDKLNWLYMHASHWIFFDTACLNAKMKDETLNEVKKLLKVNDKGSLWADVVSENTQDQLSGCAGRAASALGQMGWVFVPSQEEKDWLAKYQVHTSKPMSPPQFMVWKGVQDEVSNYIQKELPPVITEFTAPPTPEGKFFISWKMPLGSKNVLDNKVKIYHEYGECVDSFGLPTLIASLDTTQTSYEFVPNANQVVGQHMFTIEVLSSTPTVKRSYAEAKTGIYNRVYIESYGKGANGCKANNNLLTTLQTLGWGCIGDCQGLR